MEYLNEIEQVAVNPGDAPKEKIVIVDCGQIKKAELEQRSE